MDLERERRFYRILQRVLGERPESREALIAGLPDLEVEERSRLLAMAIRAEDEAQDGDGLGRDGHPEKLLQGVLGEFRIVREIGRGGMGVVYEAVQLSLRRTVALKVLPAHLTLSRETVERFHREASTAARLRHPGIVAVHAVGEDCGHHYFAMDLVHGTPLNEIVDQLRSRALEATDDGSARTPLASKRRPASDERAEGAADGVETKAARGAKWNRGYIETVCRIVAGIADALEHAHSAGVIHRDVKPSNIIVREDDTAVLTDFGLARESGLPALTQTGEFAGTPYYVSPEQALARRMKVDHRTDVYSLGVTLYELITLRRPFEGKTSQEVLGKIITKEAPLPRKLNPRVPRDLETICLTAIDKDPDRRYAHAADFAADIRRFLEFHPIVARPAGATTRVLRWMRREPLKAGLIGVLSLGIPSLLGLGLYVLARRPEIERGRDQVKRDLLEKQLEIGYLELGRKAEAVAAAAFEQAAAIDPLNPEAITGLILTRVDAAHRLASLDAHLEAEQAHPDLRRLRAGVLRDLGRISEAQGIEAQFDAPATALALFIAGNQDIRQHERTDRASFERARRNFARAVRLSPVARPYYVFQWAYAVGETHNASDVDQICDMLQNLWPQSARAWFESGFSLESVDQQRAVACYRRAIELDPDYADAYNCLGVVFSSVGDHEAARKELTRALDLDPGSTDAHNNLGIVLTDTGDLPGAIREFRRAIEIGPDSAQPHDGLATALKATGDIPGAIAEYKRAIEINPEDAGPHHNLGVILSANGDMPEAMAEFRRAIELDPALAQPHHNLGYSLSVGGDLPGAIAEYERAIELAPKNAQMREYLGDALKDAGDLPGAIAEYERAIELAPRNAQLREYLGIALEEAGDLSGAIVEYKRAIECEPESAELHDRLGSALSDNGDEPSAFVEYLKAVKCVPDNADSHFNLASALRSSGDLSGAITEYARAAELDPQSAWVHNALGVTLNECGDQQAAIREYQRGIELDPLLAKLHNNLGVSLVVVGDRPGGIAEYELALELDPMFTLAHDNLVKALSAAGDQSGVAAECRRIVELQPRSAAAHEDLGRALHACGDDPAAIVEYRQAIELDPSLVWSHNNLGFSLSLQGDFPGALVEYRRAIVLDPRLGKPHSNIIAACRAMHDLVAVRAELERWTVVFPEDPAAWNELAWFLVDPAGSAEQRDPAAALPAAKRAVDLSGAHDPGILDTLAESLFASGDPRAAIETELSALALIEGANKSEHARAESFEESLGRFREAAATQP